MSKIKFRSDVFRGEPKHPQCTFFEEFPSSPDPDCNFYGALFCHMSGEEAEAEKCKGDYLECPLAYGGKKSTADGLKEFMERETIRAAHHKADFDEIARLEKKTVAQIEADLCKDDRR